MSLGISYAVTYIVGTALCFYLWIKSKDNDYLWLSLLGLLSVIFNLARLITPFDWQPYTSVVSIVFSVTVIVLVVKILIKKR
jgi:hypothetical protein